MNNLQSEQESDLVGTLDVNGYPTILVIEKNLTYQFRGRRNILDMIEFAKTGYKNVTGIKYTGPLSFTEKVQKFFSKTFEAFVQLIDSFGLTWLPYYVKGLIPLMILFSPVFAVILCMLCISDVPEVSKETKEKIEEMNKKAQEEKKIEKPKKE